LTNANDFFQYAYDLDNRLTTVGYDNDGEGGSALTPIAEYRYDALGRRIEYVDHVRNITTRYYYDGQSIVADYTYNGSTEAPANEYVNGSQYIDERVVMRDVDYGQDHYYLLKDLYTVTGLAGSNGELEEAYVYDTYGDATIYAWPLGDLDKDGDIDYDHDETYLSNNTSGSGNPTNKPFLDLDRDGDADGTDLATLQYYRQQGPSTPVAYTYSPLDNPFLFTGRLTDTLNEEDEELTDEDETGFRRIQDNRNRTYDPKHGRWLQRDPLGVRPDAPKGTILVQKQYTDGMDLYEYVRSRSTSAVDFEGLNCYLRWPTMAYGTYWPPTCGYVLDCYGHGTGDALFTEGFLQLTPGDIAAHCDNLCCGVTLNLWHCFAGKLTDKMRELGGACCNKIRRVCGCTGLIRVSKWWPFYKCYGTWRCISVRQHG